VLSGRRWRIAAVGLIVLAIGVGLSAWRVLSWRQEAEVARQHLSEARAAIAQSSVSVEPNESTGRSAALSAQFEQACAEATAADGALRDLNGQMRGLMPLIGALEGLPGVGERARAQTTNLEAGTQLAAAGSSLCAVLSPFTALMADSEGGSGTEPATETLKALVGARPRLLEALQRFERLEATLAGTRDEDLDETSRNSVAAVRQRLPQVIGFLRDATIFLDLLGASEDRRYLLVSQNPDELRATGGNLGSAGVVSAHQGTLRLLEYDSSHRYDTPRDLRAVPPKPFQPYLGDGYWDLAGANWWPSFPDSARQMAYFYELSHPDAPVHGVVALDQFGFRRLLEVVGPVQVPEYGERVTAETLQGQIDHYVHAGDAGDEFGRKHFLAAVSSALMQRILAAPRSELRPLVAAVRKSLDEQHLLVWMADPAAADVFARRRWDGELLPAKGDTLMLVDTEVSGSKQSQHVSRDAEYEVDLREPATPTATLRVTYANTSTREQQPELPYFAEQYRTFLRVYAPTGAELTDAQGFEAPAAVDEECGRTVFSGEVVIPSSARVQVTLKYRLPPTVQPDLTYDLLVQQQPGLPPGRLSVSAIPANGHAAFAELANSPGQHVHWQLESSGSASRLEDRPLPNGLAGGCNLPLVQAQPVAAPVWVEIPSAHVAAPVVELGVEDDGQMDAPADGDVVGWYRMSARAGQPGNSVMSGHIDWGHAPAVFWGLRALRPGDRITVRGGDDVTYVYAVEWNTSFPTGAVPVQQVVGGSFDTLLTLITCDGIYDGTERAYSERRVVRARLVSEEHAQ
jgi:sortase (surface protein transpeptidase)